MKKTRMYLALCAILAVLFAACGTTPANQTPTDTPTPTATNTPAPTPTDVPAVTEAPTVTEASSATEAPTVTEASTVTEVPTATGASSVTKAPTTTAASAVTENPKATATLVPTKAPSKGAELTYNFSDLLYLTSYGTNYSIQDDGSIELQFEGQYQEIKLTLPEGIDMNYCDQVTVKAKAEFSDISVKLYDEALLSNSGSGEVFVEYHLLGDGIVDYELYPELATEVHGIGIMALNEVDDPSLYKATVYSVTFHMLPGYNEVSSEERGFDDLTLLNTYGTVFGNIGTCINLWQLQNTSTLNLVKSHYNSVTSENDMKPDALLGSSPTLISVNEAKELGYVIPDNYTESTVPKVNFTNVDKILELCAKNGLRYRAHTLVWHSQTPNWFFRTGFSKSGAFVTPEVMDARMEFYIRTVMTHVYDNEYGFVVYSWDVVNEYLNADDTNWIAVYGAKNTSPSFVKKAFLIADDVLRDYGIRDEVSLIFNDFNTYMNTQKIISIINFVNADGIICDGFGMQAHLDTGFPSTASFKNTVNAFLKTGLEVQITELDVTTKNDAAQEKYYYELMSYLLEIKKNGGKITGLTYWGLADNTSWRGQQTPLLFSTPGRPKDVYYKVTQAYLDAGYTAE